MTKSKKIKLVAKIAVIGNTLLNPLAIPGYLWFGGRMVLSAAEDFTYLAFERPDVLASLDNPSDFMAADVVVRMKGTGAAISDIANVRQDFEEVDLADVDYKDAEGF